MSPRKAVTEPASKEKPKPNVYFCQIGPIRRTEAGPFLHRLENSFADVGWRLVLQRHVGLIDNGQRMMGHPISERRGMMSFFAVCGNGEGEAYVRQVIEDTLEFGPEDWRVLVFDEDGGATGDLPKFSTRA